MTKVCHMTSAHGPEDVRIFHKECISLAEAGYDVYLVERGDSYDKRGVHIVGVGEISGGRFHRMTKGAKLVYEKALDVDAEIYHLHDPELLPYGLKLKRKGKKVIFDSHENVPAQIMGKEWIPLPLRRVVSALYARYEVYALSRLDAVVIVNRGVGERLRPVAKRVEVITNYPRLDEIQFHDTPFSEREPIVCYAGGISRARGEDIMIEAMRGVDGMLILAGKRQEAEIAGGADSSVVRYVGVLDRDGINALYGSAVAGLCLLRPSENVLESEPIKMFEYMAAGLPFVCSDFPFWKSISEESGGAICVDLNDIPAVQAAIRSLLEDREYARRMGQNGRRYVEACRNWKSEEKKLLSLYKTMREV